MVKTPFDIGRHKIPVGIVLLPYRKVGEEGAFFRGCHYRIFHHQKGDVTLQLFTVQYFKQLLLIVLFHKQGKGFPVDELCDGRCPFIILFLHG